jgi:hypothetical protein
MLLCRFTAKRGLASLRLAALRFLLRLDARLLRARLLGEAPLAA